MVLVVAMRLGCINHALLTAEALVQRGLPIAGWVANCVQADMPYLEDNLLTLQTLLPALPAPVPILAVRAAHGEWLAARHRQSPARLG